VCIVTTILAIVLEVALGGAVVCAEARGEHPWERVAVARTVRNRVERTGRPAVVEMTRPHQYARPCPVGLVRLEHLGQYVQGRWGDAPEWALEATHFVTRDRWPAVRDRWTADLTPVESGRTAHVFLEPRKG
jgi:hypothetical protein